MSNLYEKQLSREIIYDGKVMRVVRDTVELPNGDTSVREICQNTGAVAIIPLLDDGRVIMERQYRYAHERVFFEIPAGKLDSPDEPHLDAAMRELREETGAVAKKYTYLGRIDPSPAIFNEKIYLYLAEGLSFTERELDEDEFIDTETVPLTELYDMVMNGEICDSKTQIAVLKVYNMKKG